MRNFRKVLGEVTLRRANLKAHSDILLTIKNGMYCISFFFEEKHSDYRGSIRKKLQKEFDMVEISTYNKNSWYNIMYGYKIRMYFNTNIDLEYMDKKLSKLNGEYKVRSYDYDKDSFKYATLTIDLNKKVEKAIDESIINRL